MTIISDPATVSSLSETLRAVPVILYIGPDQIMPLTSVLGAIAGIALMFWNRLVSLFVKVRSLFGRRTDAAGEPSSK